MLSNKMTVSLMSLITIFALAFVAPSAMAATFGADLITTNDVSHKDDLQLELPAAADHLGITVKYAKAIKLANTQVFVAIYDSDGDLSSIPTIAAAAADEEAADTAASTTMVAFYPAAAAQEFTFRVPAELLEAGSKVEIKIAKGIASADVIDEDTTEAKTFTVYALAADTADTAPDVLKIALVGESFATVTTSEFQVHVLLSEDVKKDGLKAAGLDVGDATVKSVTKLASPPESMLVSDIGIVQRSGQTAFTATTNAGDLDTWRDGKLHLYLVTLTTKGPGEKTATIKVNNFAGNEIPESNEAQEMYTRNPDVDLVEGRDILRVKTKLAAAVKKSGIRVNLAKDKVIPAGGYLIAAENKGESQIIAPATADDAAPDTTKDSGGQLQYKIIESDIPNLETFLSNGGIIDVESPHPLVITEVMWGSDASLATPSNNQWIELYNAGAQYKTGEDDASTAGNEAVTLVFYGPNDTPPAMTAATATTPAQLPAGVTDRIGTIDATGAYWSTAGKGQSGRTGQGEQAGGLLAVIPTQSVASMYRVMVDSTATNAAAGAMMVADGTKASSWKQSTPPNVNFSPSAIGVRIGSPGAARLVTAAEAAAAAAETTAAETAADDTSVSMPAVGQIYISEVMFAGGGTLPQWIEISNGSRTEEVNLSGWTITVDNATADADVSVGASIELTIPEGTRIDPSGQNDTPSTILVVTEAGRTNLSGATASGQVLNLWTANQTELILAGVTKRRYSLLSEMAFQITLAPPAPKATKPPATETAAEKATRLAAERVDANARKAATDTVGNLGADGAAAWALPMSEEGGRSSIIRRHVPVRVGPASPEAGIMMDSWVLASDTSFAQVTHIRASSYYGAANDVGTPGFRAGGALPVELSHFRPARDKATGQVVITWSTQSELNNAGFFIKRSQQKDGEFKVINATMVAGAGTTSEKQFYTYTDTTAQPNVVYYYQIEDVSLDGNRQTLTRGIRLKGHVSVAGKATLTWGELKTSNE